MLQKLFSAACDINLRNLTYLIDYYVNSCNSGDGIVNALIGGIRHSDIQYIVPGQSRRRMASIAAGEQHLRLVKELTIDTKVSELKLICL